MVLRKEECWKTNMRCKMRTIRKDLWVLNAFESWIVRGVFIFGVTTPRWPCGLTDKASDFGSEDCRFESCHGRELFFFPFFSFSTRKFSSNHRRRNHSFELKSTEFYLCKNTPPPAFFISRIIIILTNIYLNVKQMINLQRIVESIIVYFHWFFPRSDR